jgi:hypothetical protein
MIFHQVGTTWRVLFPTNLHAYLLDTVKNKHSLLYFANKWYGIYFIFILWLLLRFQPNSGTKPQCRKFPVPENIWSDISVGFTRKYAPTDEIDLVYDVIVPCTYKKNVVMKNKRKCISRKCSTQIYQSSGKKKDDRLYLSYFRNCSFIPLQCMCQRILF